jgi:hypothetical protein
MKSNNFRNKISRVLLALSFIAGIGLVSSSAVQAQGSGRDRDYRRDQDRNRRDRDYDRNRDNRRNDQYDRNGGYGNGGYGNGGYGNGGYGNYNQVAMNQGYQDGLYTGSNDAQRGQSYDPQRSHFYRNGHSDNGNYRGNSQAYRSGFVRGYDEGFRRFGGNRRNNGNYGRRWPF